MTGNIFNLDKKVISISEKALNDVKDVFDEIDSLTEYNQNKVLKAFIDNKASESHFTGTTGYGYGDAGRETANRITADILGTEDAIISYNMACGTHALTIALFALLRPGDAMLSITGRPYDTICPVIGMDGSNGSGSLADFNIEYIETPLDEYGKINLEKVKDNLKKRKNIKLIYIQRSRGYTLRDSLSVEDIKKAVNAAREVSDAPVMVDNCYGEFAEVTEPSSAGADLLVGSLIKNPGGGMAKCGGYIAGKKRLVELSAARLTTPSLGREVGATLGSTREILMGLFNAPHIVGESLKTAVFASSVFELAGYETFPKPKEERHDIIEAIKLKNSENLIAFCRGIQKKSPIDSFLTPEPWDMPGYTSKVIMASGAFTSGSSIELSADAPLREPFAVWMQGGFNFHSAKAGVMSALESVLKTEKII